MNPPGGDAAFPDTMWSMVLSARDATPQRVNALERLCRHYWRPVFTFIRRQGAGELDAEDLTQGFFARLLQGQTFAGLERERGKFRTYLLGAVRHYMSDEWRRTQTQKRGGGQQFIPLEELSAAGLEPPARESDSPERAFDRRWALSLLERVKERLREECDRAGKPDLFRAVFHDQAAPKELRAAVAERLGMTENALNLAARRLRERYEQIIREEIAQTVTTPLEVDDEIRYLLEVLAS